MGCMYITLAATGHGVSDNKYEMNWSLCVFLFSCFVYALVYTVFQLLFLLKKNTQNE